MTTTMETMIEAAVATMMMMATMTMAAGVGVVVGVVAAVMTGMMTKGDDDEALPDNVVDLADVRRGRMRL